ncbi:MAG: hypothetical protein MJY88_07575 [Bacteroidales bacterium]|nr:hypothetical protein [Bacteroidales bacterium]
MNGRSSIPRFLAAVLSFVSILCCSVKEDRDSCPCNLRFDLSEAFKDSDGSLTMVIKGPDGFVCCDTLRTGNDSLYTVLVPRRELTVDFYTPYGVLRNPLEGYRPDKTCAPVWHWSEVLTAEGEMVERKVRPHKDYCRLTVELVGSPGVAFPYSLLFVSNINGYLPGGGLSEGMFVERVAPGTSGGLSAGNCSVNLLRQKDSSLMMEVVPEGQTAVSLRSFAIGEYLAAAGYDWTAADLEDVEITLDFAAASILVATDKWTRRLEFSVVI